MIGQPSLELSILGTIASNRWVGCSVGDSWTGSIGDGESGNSGISQTARISGGEDNSLEGITSSGDCTWNVIVGDGWSTTVISSTSTSVVI